MEIAWIDVLLERLKSQHAYVAYAVMGLISYIVPILLIYILNQQRLKERERWRSLLDNVRLIVIGLDHKGRINYINPHGLEVMGYEYSEIAGCDWFDCCIPRHQAGQIKQIFENALTETGHPRAYYENSILTKTGKERLIAWNNTVLKDPAGASIGTMSIGEDITERYAVQRMKDEFISVVSHELRTPLTSIHGALELLNSGLLPMESERGLHVLKIAADNSHRLVRLVNDILELERLESGKIKLNIQAIPTTELTARAQELMQVLAERSQIELHIQDAGLMLLADGDRLIQVLTNLLDNAIKFSSTQSQVYLSIEAGLVSVQYPGQPHQALFKVQDYGRGIPAEQQEHIFERFQQVDASDSRRKGGTGLGLAICRSIVHQHGGRIWVESQVGQGSCFFFSIPLALPSQMNEASHNNLQSAHVQDGHVQDGHVQDSHVLNSHAQNSHAQDSRHHPI